MDPALQEMLEGPPDEVLEVLMRLADPVGVPREARVVARFGEVVTARIPRSEVGRVWADRRVLSLKAPRLLDYPEDAVIPAAPAESAALPARGWRGPETGAGIVLGVLDWGFDLAAPAFRRPDGGSRVLALWDQREGRHVLPGRRPSYGYGRMIGRAEIDAALRRPDPEAALRYRAADADAGSGAHGTHVADIAAGTPGPGREGGMAPGAGLVFVNLAAGQLGGLAGLGDSVRILEGLDFVRRVAGRRPFVVNLSLGRHAGPQNGTTLVERAIDALLGAAPGRAVVMSTGNYHLARAHAAGVLRPGRQQELGWRVGADDPTGNELELWYPDRDRLHVTLLGPLGTPRVEAPLGHNQPITVAGQEVGRLYHRAFDPNSADHHVDIFLRPGAPAGDWTLLLRGEEISDGRWHASAERDGGCAGCQSVLLGPHLQTLHTLGAICNGMLSIAVGAAAGAPPHPAIAPFSSSGPTRDGRLKPDLVAPGVAILATRSRSAAAPEGGLTRKSGASQAAPYVAGTIALAFEAAGRPLTIHETRAAIIGTARPLRLPAREALRAGAGLVEPCSAIRRARELGVTPQTPAAKETTAMYTHSTAFRARPPGWDGSVGLQENPAVAAGAARLAGVLGGIGAGIDVLGKAIDFGRDRIFTGAFTLSTQEARVVPLPRGLGPEFTTTRIFRLRCVQPVISDDIMAFQVAITADCFNIYNVSIVRHEAGSAFLINSTLNIRLRPDAQQVRGTTRANIPFWIEGRWDPTGPAGDEDFSGRLLVQADGSAELTINAPGNRVRVEGVSRFGPGQSCPVPAQADPGAPGTVPIAPPDQGGGRASGGARGGGARPAPYPDSRHLLPAGPEVTHVFFLTSGPELTTNERNRLQTWLNRLGSAVVEQIRNGGVPVFVTGHASRAGNAVQNMELSTRRARAAAEALRGLLGAAANIRFQGMGSDGAVGTHPNDQANRRATIRLQIPR
ncbi:S8 family serine peptidase [Pseudoroseomonas globiformis]|uniref:S8 family serine peptidase n=1 Tax=Teichococcus globiformis TaxID=2307229 RepID=A0ABV7GB60_9PROT